MPEPKFLYVNGFRSNAQLLLDVRDWYAGTFRTDAVAFLPSTTPGVPAVPVQAIIRPAGPVQVFASAVAGSTGSGRWPFTGEVELVTVTTPSGTLAFHGRVRSPGGPLLRVPLQGAQARLTIRCPGYETATVSQVTIPHRDLLPEVIRVDLLPGSELPPGKTELAGGVFQANGTAIYPATVNVTPQGQQAVIADTDPMGLWRAQLPQVQGAALVDVKIDVEINASKETLGVIQVRPGRANQVPQTVLRGVVRKQNTGDPVAAARVTVDVYPGRETATRADGSWVLYPKLADQIGQGFQDATIRVATNGQQRAVPARIYRSQANTIPTIQL